jgi:hypothetical protein
MYVPHLTRRALQVRHPVLRRPMFPMFVVWVLGMILGSSHWFVNHRRAKIYLEPGVVVEGGVLNEVVMDEGVVWRGTTIETTSRLPRKTLRC